MRQEGGRGGERRSRTRELEEKRWLSLSRRTVPGGGREASPRGGDTEALPRLEATTQGGEGGEREGGGG
eukprot:3133480-Rhodomonas_salina.2